MPKIKLVLEQKIVKTAPVDFSHVQVYTYPITVFLQFMHVYNARLRGSLKKYYFELLSCERLKEPKGSLTSSYKVVMYSNCSKNDAKLIITELFSKVSSLNTAFYLRSLK